MIKKIYRELSIVGLFIIIGMFARVVNAGELPSVSSNPREYLIGVNLAGAEFHSENPNFGFPTEKTLDYYNERGIRFIRLPFSWERIQPELGGELNKEYADTLVKTIKMMCRKNMIVLLDLHNYAKYNGKKISEGGFTYEQFGDVWNRIAKLVEPYQNCIWGYGLMNEPWISREQKVPFWQAGIDAVRKYDKKSKITVSGEALKSEKEPKQFELKDPSRKLVYEVHFYFDHDNSGTYKNTYEEETSRKYPRVNPMIGVQRLKKTVEICEDKNIACIVGEFGVPAGDGVDTRWQDAMENVMQYMHEHRISSTYWSGGEYWTRRGTGYVIGENGWKPGEHVGEDRPQMKILMKYVKLQNKGK